MELAGLKQCITEVKNISNTPITDLITDRHPQVRKYMRENHGGTISHFFDIWHVAKGMGLSQFYSFLCDKHY